MRPAGGGSVRPGGRRGGHLGGAVRGQAGRPQTEDGGAGGGDHPGGGVQDAAQHLPQDAICQMKSLNKQLLKLQ